MEKVCKKCGTDVSQGRRIKDPHGNYFCETCYATAKAARDASRPAPTPAADASRDELDFAEPAAAKTPASDYDLLPVEEKTEEPKAPCGVCKQFRPAHLVQFIDGESICNSCLAGREKKPASKTTSRESQEDRPPSGFVRFMSSGAGIVVTAIASIVCTFAIMTLMFAATDGAKMADSTHGPVELQFSSFVFLGAIATGLVVFLSLLLLVSMLLVDKILGGVGFGTVAGVIWKSMLIITIQTALNIWGNISEGVSFSNYVIGPTFNLIGFMVLFRLDFFESMLLSAANWILGFGGIILFAHLVRFEVPMPEIHRAPVMPGHHEDPDEPETPGAKTNPASAPVITPRTKPATKTETKPAALLPLPGVPDFTGTAAPLSRLMLLRKVA